MNAREIESRISTVVLRFYARIFQLLQPWRKCPKSRSWVMQSTTSSTFTRSWSLAQALTILSSRLSLLPTTTAATLANTTNTITSSKHLWPQQHQSVLCLQSTMTATPQECFQTRAWSVLSGLTTITISNIIISNNNTLCPQHHLMMKMKLLMPLQTGNITTVIINYFGSLLYCYI